jgi:hypothetical protein
VLEGVGVASDQWFGAAADPGTPFASTAAVPLFLGVAAIGAIPLLVYLRHLGAAPHHESAPSGATSRA